MNYSRNKECHARTTFAIKTACCNRICKPIISPFHDVFEKIGVKSSIHSLSLDIWVSIGGIE